MKQKRTRIIIRINYNEYITEITNNVKEIEKCSMADYFLDTYDIVKIGL